MKKKISYANIEKKALNMVIGECYGLGDYTLKDELDKYGEDIIVAQYNLKSYEGPNDSHHYIEWFRAWTKTKTMCMVSSGFGDNVILALDRDIPEELGGNKNLTGADHIRLLKPLFDTTIEDAVKILNKQGYCFSIERMTEYFSNGRSEEKRKRAKRRNSKTNRR